MVFICLESFEEVTLEKKVETQDLASNAFEHQHPCIIGLCSIPG